MFLFIDDIDYIDFVMSIVIQRLSIAYIGIVVLFKYYLIQFFFDIEYIEKVDKFIFRIFKFVFFIIEFKMVVIEVSFIVNVYKVIIEILRKN